MHENNTSSFNLIVMIIKSILFIECLYTYIFIYHLIYSDLHLLFSVLSKLKIYPKPVLYMC